MKNNLVLAISFIALAGMATPAIAENMPGWTPWMPGVNGNPVDGSPPPQWQPRQVYPGQEPFYWNGVALYDQTAQQQGQAQPYYGPGLWGGMPNFWGR